jgi:hypothetical protein
LEAGHLTPNWADKVFSAEDAASVFLHMMQSMINHVSTVEDMMSADHGKIAALQAHVQSLQSLCAIYREQQQQAQFGQAAAAQLQASVTDIARMLQQQQPAMTPAIEQVIEQMGRLLPELLRCMPHGGANSSGSNGSISLSPAAAAAAGVAARFMPTPISVGQQQQYSVPPSPYVGSGDTGGPLGNPFDPQYPGGYVPAQGGAASGGQQPFPPQQQPPSQQYLQQQQYMQQQFSQQQYPPHGSGLQGGAGSTADFPTQQQWQPAVPTQGYMSVPLLRLHRALGPLSLRRASSMPNNSSRPSNSRRASVQLRQLLTQQQPP